MSRRLAALALALAFLAGAAWAGEPGRSVEIEQLSPAMVGRGRSVAAGVEGQAARRGPADSGAANIVPRDEGRPPAAAAIGGQDRCDGAAGHPACSAVIENRAGEFARSAPPELPAGLGFGELVQQGQRGAFPGAAATSAEAAAILGRQSAAAASPVPAPDPAQQAAVNAVLQVVGR